MPLPHIPITELPNTEPDMVPSLWNKTYREIDENFISLDRRLEAIEAYLFRKTLDVRSK